MLSWWEGKERRVKPLTSIPRAALQDQPGQCLSRRKKHCQGGWPWPRWQVLAQLSFSFSFSVLPWQYFKVQILIGSKAIKMGRVPGRCLAWTPVGSQGAGMASGSLCASSSPSWGPNIWTEKMLGRWRPLFCPANSCDPFLQFPLLSIACVGAHVAWSRSLR